MICRHEPMRPCGLAVHAGGVGIAFAFAFRAEIVEIGRIKIILAGNAGQDEQRVAASQRRTRATRSNRAGGPCRCCRKDTDRQQTRPSCSCRVIIATLYNSDAILLKPLQDRAIYTIKRIACGYCRNTERSAS
jgi:hypothetical protein